MKLRQTGRNRVLESSLLSEEQNKQFAKYPDIFKKLHFKNAQAEALIGQMTKAEKEVEDEEKEDEEKEDEEKEDEEGEDIEKMIKKRLMGSYSLLDLDEDELDFYDEEK